MPSQTPSHKLGWREMFIPFSSKSLVSTLSLQVIYLVTIQSGLRVYARTRCCSDWQDTCLLWETGESIQALGYSVCLCLVWQRYQLLSRWVVILSSWYEIVYIIASLWSDNWPLWSGLSLDIMHSGSFVHCAALFWSILSYQCIESKDLPINQKRKGKTKEQKKQHSFHFLCQCIRVSLCYFVSAVVYPVSLYNIKLLTMMSRNERSLFSHDYSSWWWSRCILVLWTPNEETGIY